MHEDFHDDDEDDDNNDEIKIQGLAKNVKDTYCKRNTMTMNKTVNPTLLISKSWFTALIATKCSRNLHSQSQATASTERTPAPSLRFEYLTLQLSRSKYCSFLYLTWYLWCQTAVGIRTHGWLKRKFPRQLDRFQPNSSLPLQTLCPCWHTRARSRGPLWYAGKTWL